MVLLKGHGAHSYILDSILDLAPDFMEKGWYLFPIGNSCAPLAADLYCLYN